VSANKYLMLDEKILCLGSNDYDTDQRTQILANDNNTLNHGLISDAEFVPELPGYYHTTVIDLSTGEIITLSKHFDKILFLDQSQEQWSHWKPMLTTYKIMLELDKLGYQTLYKDNENIKKFKLFFEMVQENKSFCIYPWIELTENSGHLTVCSRSTKKIKSIEKLQDWKTDPEYTKIRQSMLAGELLPDHCSYCYDYEKLGIESYRQFETKDWISKLDINSVEDLDKIDQPYYYEIRLSNKCNLMCRGCKPEYSNLIENEYKKFNIEYRAKQTFTYSNLDLVNIDTLTANTRIYLTGGEPTIMSDVLTFMKQCIKKNKTNFDFSILTNGVKLSTGFLKLIKHFTNVNFSVSIDGYGKVNDYYRWGSDFDSIIKNVHLLRDLGYPLSINCVPGIYNVTNLHLLYEFLDQEFPNIGMYLQTNAHDLQSAYNHPNSKLVVESMARCKQTKIYYADGKSNQTCIDSLYTYYSNNPTPNLQHLKEFFNYNDQLDRARNVRLADYVPELEACRKLVDQ
jgi:pyruvate-formate lyase-activating enzyme